MNIGKGKEEWKGDNIFCAEIEPILDLLIKEIVILWLINIFKNMAVKGLKKISIFMIYRTIKIMVN